MRRTEIHLSEPFEEVLASVLRLPSTLAEIDEVRLAGAADSELRKSAKCDAEVKKALRSLYEAAHGRHVETQIGFVTIAPPVAGFLKETPYSITTQYRIFSGSVHESSRWSFASQRSNEWFVDVTRQTRHESPRNKRAPPPHKKRKPKCFPLPNIVTIDEQPLTNAPMTNLPIHITTHHLSMSNALRRFAREKISSVSRFANDALGADVVLRRHAGHLRNRKTRRQTGASLP